MLSRVTLVSRNAQASCRRFASTSKSTVPLKPTSPAGGAARPQTVQPITQAVGTPGSVTQPQFQAPGFDFKRAQMGLPKRLYSKSGILASRLYGLTEFKHPSNKAAEINKVAEDLVSLRNELTAHPKAGRAFLTPTYSKVQKEAFIGQFSKLLKLHPLVQALTLNLVKTNTTAQFPRVVDDFLALKDARDDIVKVSLTLASKDQPQPKPETIRTLLGYGPKTQIKLSVNYDPSIEGGAIIRSTDKLVDLTFRRELRQLRENLEKTETTARSQKRRLFDEQIAAINAWQPTPEELAKIEKDAQAILH